MLHTVTSVRSAIQAQHYYNFVFGQSWYPLIELPEGGGQSAGRISPPPAEQSPANIELPSPGISLEVIPNPVRESVQFQYTFPSEEGKAVLRLFDPSGRLIQSWELEQRAGAIHWQVGPLMPKGIYLVTLELDRRKVVSRRFSIVE